MCSWRYLPLALAIWLATATSVSAAEIEASSAIDTATVYPDGATVTRVIRVTLPVGDTTLVVRDFPPSLDPASLRVEGEGGARLVISAIDARPPRQERPATNPALEQRMEALRDERGVLDDKIAAAEARRKFALRFAESAPAGLGEKGEARPLSEWRAAFAAIAEEVAASNDMIREAKLRQREIDRQLLRLESEGEANPPRKMEVRIDLLAGAAAPATLRVSYSVRGARWVPLYDARLDSGSRTAKPALELVRRASVVQNSGEDWTEVKLFASTVRTARGGSARELQPLIVRFDDPERVSQPAPRAARPAGSARRAGGGRGGAARSRDEPAEEREATAETGGFQVVFDIPGRVSVATNEGAKSFRLGTANVTPDLMVRSAPALDNTAFLEATFKHAEEAPLLPGRVAIYRDGVFVGRGGLALTQKDETVRLGFGADEKVKVTRVPVRRIEGSTGIISSSKIDEREFKTTVRNGHDTPLRIVIEDQVPVSEVDEVKVDILPVTTPPTQRDVRDRRGVLSWEFEAQPGEVREIKLGWRVRWPPNRAIAYDPPQP